MTDHAQLIIRRRHQKNLQEALNTLVASFLNQKISAEQCSPIFYRVERELKAKKSYDEIADNLAQPESMSTRAPVRTKYPRLTLMFDSIIKSFLDRNVSASMVRNFLNSIETVMEHDPSLNDDDQLAQHFCDEVTMRRRIPEGLREALNLGAYGALAP